MSNQLLDTTKGIVLDISKVIGLVTVGIFIGRSVQSDVDVRADVEDNKGIIVEVKELIQASEKRSFEYTTQEVGGLRSDWERQNKINEYHMKDFQDFKAKYFDDVINQLKEKR